MNRNDSVTRQPNFFFIGGMRCGSTTLHHMLDQHPDLFMSPIKEPYFYLPETIRRINAPSQTDLEELATLEANGKYRSPETYFKLFEGSVTARYVGESSHYLYHPRVAETIYDDCPDAKILICLRDPSDRLFSEYLLQLRRGDAQGDFKSYVKELTSSFVSGTLSDKAKVPRLNKGLQYSLILPWLEIFGEDKVKLVMFEDLKNDPQAVAADIFEWLSISPNFSPVVVHTQRGGAPKGKSFVTYINPPTRLASLIKSFVPNTTRIKLRSWLYAKSLERPEMDLETSSFLRDFYMEDVLKLQAFLNKALK